MRYIQHSVSVKLTIPQRQPLGFRAWAYQERILSPRVLNFTSYGTLWKCSQIQAREDGLVTPRKDQFAALTDANSREHWYSRDSKSRYWALVVSQYTGLSMTDLTDKLPALSGIIARLQQVTGDVCYAGLWKSRFIESLLWMRRPGISSARLPQHASRQWVAPS